MKSKKVAPKKNGFQAKDRVNSLANDDASPNDEP